MQLQCAAVAPRTERLSGVPVIRVLIGESKSLSVKLNGSYDFASESANPRIPKGAKMEMRAVNGQVRMTFQGRVFKFKGSVRLRARDQRQQFELAGKPYFGNLAIKTTGGNLLAINSLDLETYVKGVIPAEMGRQSKSEIEALKAQAVAARTFALRKIKMINALHGSGDFDIRAGTSDQAYIGRENFSKWTDQAVDETHGEIITFRGDVALCFYHSTCGGRTESAREVFAMNGAPYLSGVADDFGQGDFCRASPHYRWRESFSLRELAQSIKRVRPSYSNASNSNKMQGMKVLRRFPSGRVDKLGVLLASGVEIEIGSASVRNFFSPPGGGLLRSNLFRILNSSGDQIVLVGAGSGHGVGMCQWGAIGMAKAGYNYNQILKHYYRDTVIQKRY